MSEGDSPIDDALAHAQRLLDRKDFDAAFNQFQAVLRVDFDNLTALTGMGKILVVGEQFDEAIRILSHATEVAPDVLEPRSALVSLLHQQGRSQEILPHIDTLIELDPLEPKWYSMAAYRYKKLGDVKKVNYYIELGQKQASRGIDWQAGTRFSLPENVLEQLNRNTRELIDSLSGEMLQASAAARTWTAQPGDDGAVDLRGAWRGVEENWRASFEITADDDPITPAITIKAEPDETVAGGNVKAWRGVADNLEPGKTYTCRLMASDGTDTLDGGKTTFTSPSRLPPETETGDASLIGTDGATIFGSAGGTSLPTRTWFAWGTEAGKLTNATPPRPLPPGRTLRVRDVPYHNLKRWLIYAVDSEMKSPSGQAEGEKIPYNVLRLTAPYGKDRNHLSGAGVADLLCGWDCTVQPLEDIDGRFAGDSLDLRDAEVEFTLASPGLDAKDFLLSFWLHTYTGRTSTNIESEDSSPWGLTGQLIDPAQLNPDAKTFRFTLSCLPEAWTYAGTNPEEQPVNYKRYTYHPLHDVLADHRGNMVLIFLFGDERVTPEGNIDIHAGSLKCRNPSLLAPGTAARLVSWPGGSLADPQSLTNGWVGNPDHFWISGPYPDEPGEFVWDLGAETVVKALRLRQNPLFPAQRVEILGGGSADDWQTLWETDLPAEPAGENDEWSVFRVLDRAATVRFLKLRILSGHRNDFWGLDALEVFGGGPDPRPELEPCTLCEDITDLTPGSEIFYQLVAENEAGESRGDIRSLTLPEDQTPIIYGAEVFSQEPGKTTVLVRINAMGLEATLSGHCEDDDGNALKDASRPAGSEKTPRHITFVAAGVAPGTRYRLELTAENEAGTSPPLALEWETPEEKKK